MFSPLSLTLFNAELSESFDGIECIETQLAADIFRFFNGHPLFNWQLNHNFCEARAEAVSLLLGAAHVPHVKCWLMGGAFLKWGYTGALRNNWNYHVAIALPVKHAGLLEWLVIDPSTANWPVPLESWAAWSTAYSHSYYFLKDAAYYVFPGNELHVKEWHKRRHRNFRWTMQGLIGINGLTYIGKAELVFKKRQIARVTERFMQVRGGMWDPGVFSQKS